MSRLHPQVRDVMARLKRLRKKHGVTLAQVAEILGKSETTLHHLESGARAELPVSALLAYLIACGLEGQLQRLLDEALEVQS